MNTLCALSLTAAMVLSACNGASPASTQDQATPRSSTTSQAPETTAASTVGPLRTPRFHSTPAPAGSPEPPFDGTFYGWRFAPTEVLQKAGFNGGDPRDCEGQEYGATHPTDLDFDVAYLPSGPRSEEVTKSACGDRAYFVNREIFFDESGGDVIMTHVLSGEAMFSLDSPASLVEACEIAGRPAVCVHYRDDASGRAEIAQIIILDHPALDPYGVVFRLQGGELPFSELVKIASSVTFQ